jgi:putative molybdopterin biosynthesis protein
MSQSKRQRRYYLDDVPLDDAVAKFHNALRQAGALRPSPAETVALDSAIGRVTAEPIWAKASSPHYDAAAMDGVAVRARDTAGATETSPVRLSIGEQATFVDTGDPMPPGSDAVIMIEVVHRVDDTTIEIQSPVPPYHHVRPLGEDIAATELVLPENHLLRPVDVGACAAAGLTHLEVRKRPRVALIPTGTELVPPGSPVEAGDIIEFNTLMLAGMVEEWGGEPDRREVIPDDYDKLRVAVASAAAEYDIVVVNAGSSAGSEDYTARTVENLGTLLVHGTAIRPGHPVVLGLVAETPVLGIPGYPVSAVLTCEIFVKPLIEAKLGVKAPRRKQATATLSRKVSSPMGEDEFLRVRLGRVGQKLVATPIQRGAGVIMSLVRADGLVTIPRLTEGFDVGQEVTVDLLRPSEDVERTIVATGSHDLTLDLMASHVRRLRPDISLASSNVGSLGGLLALSRGEAHMAGCHLLDEDTGEYNTPFVQKHLAGTETVVVNLVHRVQGLIVPRGNPKGISGLVDLTRDDVTFANRQRGSGTRVLLDYRLRQSGTSPDLIAGYQREEYTHLAVAAAVAGGSVDVGLGILSASRAMGLDFVPLLTEQYDLVIPREHYGDELLEPVLTLMGSDTFKSEVEALGGYDVSSMGRVVAEL